MIRSGSEVDALASENAAVILMSLASFRWAAFNFCLYRSAIMFTLLSGSVT